MKEILNLIRCKDAIGCFDCVKFRSGKVYPDDELLIPDKKSLSESSTGSTIERSILDIRHALNSVFTKGHNTLTLFLGTWNMNGRIPATDPHAFLDYFHIHKESPDILVIGTQECEKPLEVSVFFPSKEEWEKILKNHYSIDYQLLSNETLGGLHIAIYSKLNIISRISNLKIGKVATGDAGFSNKGGIGISFKLYDLQFLIINSHLSAHQLKVKERNNEYLRIEQGLYNLKGRYEKKQKYPSHASDRYDYCFWIGDLNYRIQGKSSLISKCIQDKRLEVLLSNDQLLKEIKSSQVWILFNEADITFLPTYKFQKNTQEYDSERSSSWTDRILFKHDNKYKLSCNYYTSINDTFGSDHQPVVASFKLDF